MPTLPKNIAAQSSISDFALSAGVTPNEEPTVNNADKASNSRSLVDNPGSMITRVVAKKK